jgi:putative addiction module killer protein
MRNHGTISFRLRELLSDDGSSPYASWFGSLDDVAAAKVVTAAVRMECGNLSSVRWFRGIGEYRIDWGSGYRIYFARAGARTLLLLGGGTKKTQQRDIERALLLLSDHKKRHGRG